MFLTPGSSPKHTAQGVFKLNKQFSVGEVWVLAWLAEDEDPLLLRRSECSHLTGIIFYPITIFSSLMHFDTSISPYIF